MKILKMPVETTIKCGCGCMFEFDCEDLIINTIISLNGPEMIHVAVKCPFCGINHVLINRE